MVASSPSLRFYALLMLAVASHRGLARSEETQSCPRSPTEERAGSCTCPVRVAGNRPCDCALGMLSILHVTRHAGLEVEVRATLGHLCCVEVRTFAFNDGVNVDGDEAGLNYNVHPHRAQLAWAAHGAWFQTFDAILVSDVTAMARPFLQQPAFTKPLFIWVCNRFDFSNQDHEFVLSHRDMLEHGYFPDAAYYSLMQGAAAQANVSLLLSNGFEAHYAEHWRRVDWSKAPILYPAGLGNRPSVLHRLSPVVADGGAAAASSKGDQLLAPGLYGGHTLETLPRQDWLDQTILVPDRGIVSGSCPSHDGVVRLFKNNEANLGVPEMLRDMGFAVYHGRYENAEQAASFKAVIRIPNNYMTTAFHQLLAAGAVMFVPAPAFLLRLSEDENFWWNTHWDVEDHRVMFEEMQTWSCPQQLSTLSAETVGYVYEYDSRHQGALVYFNSWHDLELKLRTTDFEAVRTAAVELSQRLSAQVLHQWEGLLCRL